MHVIDLRLVFVIFSFLHSPYSKPFSSLFHRLDIVLHLPSHCKQIVKLFIALVKNTCQFYGRTKMHLARNMHCTEKRIFCLD